MSRDDSRVRTLRHALVLLCSLSRTKMREGMIEEILGKYEPLREMEIPPHNGCPATTCSTCRFGECRAAYAHGQDRVTCMNPKVFGIDGLDEDGAEEFEAAELHFGPSFGCIHFEPNAPICANAHHGVVIDSEDSP